MRRPPAIVVVGVVAASIFVAGFFVVVPGSSPPAALPPLSPIEPAISPSIPAATDVAPAPRGTAPRFLDHRVVDPAAPDRSGNPTRRDVSAAELRRLALEYDVIDDDLRGQPDGVALTDAQIAAMRAINPRLKVLRHMSLLDNREPPFNGAEPGDGEHASWFLTDAQGDDVRLRPPAYGSARTRYAPDPADVNVRLEVAAQVRQYLGLGYDGVVLDDVFVTVPDAFLSRPLDPATGQPYIDAAWQQAVAGLLVEVRRVAGPDAYVAIAGGTAAEYADASVYLDVADAVVARDFAAPGALAADVAALDALAARGKGVVAVASDGVPGRTAYASFLLALPAGDAWFAATSFDAAPPGAYPPQPSYARLDLGAPLGPAAAIGAVWLRRFKRGVVAVNAGAAAQDVALPAPYRAADGTAVDRVTVAGGDAVILPAVP